MLVYMRVYFRISMNICFRMPCHLTSPRARFNYSTAMYARLGAVGRERHFVVFA